MPLRRRWAGSATIVSVKANSNLSVMSLRARRRGSGSHLFRKGKRERLRRAGVRRLELYSGGVGKAVMKFQKGCVRESFVQREESPAELDLLSDRRSASQEACRAASIV